MKKQHTKPCSDCPWRRNAIRSWLGIHDIEFWLQEAHSEAWVECHKAENRQCAGMAIYRANVCKAPRFPEILVLPPNNITVFSSPIEFQKHHTIRGKIKDITIVSTLRKAS